MNNHFSSITVFRKNKKIKILFHFSRIFIIDRLRTLGDIENNPTV